MKNIINIFFFAAALILAFTIGMLLCKYFLEKNNFKNKEKLQRQAAGIDDAEFNNNFLCEGFAKKLLSYMVKVAYALSFISSEAKISLKFVKSNTLNSKMQKLCFQANMPDVFRNYAYREIQIRLSFIFCLLGALIGSVFSYLLMFILFIAGIILGIYLPVWAIKQEKLARNQSLDKYLPEMLDVVSLGLRSGLTFDRSLKIYTQHFKNNFSDECNLVQRKWESGITLRETALRDFAKKYSNPMFARVIENIIRSIRFGSSLVESLESAAEESRTLYKSKQEEIVAKAPVKMMIPTGTLILPAMLMMILGPVLLELIGGF